MKLTKVVKTKVFRIVILICLIILIILCLLFIYNKIINIEPIDNIKINDIPNVKWPFINLKDENNNNINILGITAHMEEKYKPIFLKYIQMGIPFIGVSSYLSFPRYCNNKNGYCHIDSNIRINGKYIEEYVLGWCHCFREPHNYIRGNIPTLLLSESDFNSDRLIPDKNISIIYDYIIVQPNDNDQCELKWHSHNKNWKLAEKCIKILSDKLNLKGLIIGRDKCPININNKNKVESTPFLQFNEFITKLNMCKFVVFPNLEDASPRIITESLCLNKPILVNKDILGGWKYVNNQTGEFFTKDTIEQQTLQLLNNYHDYNPRNYYVNNYGLQNSGKIFRDFLKSIYPKLSPCKYVKFNIQ